MNFEAFKASEPARAIFSSLGMSQILEAARGWAHLQRLIVAFNDCDQGHFVKRVEKRAGTASTGERVLLSAICFMADFAWLADKLDTRDRKSKAWDRMGYVHGEWRAAVVACIAGQD